MSAAQIAVERARLHGYVSVWAKSTARQGERVLDISAALVAKPLGAGWDEDIHDQVEYEVALFAVALRNLIRAVEWAAKSHAPTLTTALKQFHQVIPNAVDVRNLLEHFDAYEQGRGRLQKLKRVTGRAKGQPAIADYSFSFAHTAGTVLVEFSGGPVLDVGAATFAAGQLASTALAALL
jgi:hypothetical protein